METYWLLGKDGGDSYCRVKPKLDSRASKTSWEMCPIFQSVTGMVTHNEWKYDITKYVGHFLSKIFGSDV